MSDNYNNIQWFNQLPIEQLKKINTDVGLESCNGSLPEDIKHLVEILSNHNCNEILEIGGGYGRVIDHLTSAQLGNSITAIEPNKPYADYLSDKFKNSSIIKTENVDLFAFASLPVFNVNLLLGASLTQFTPEEQLLVFIKVKSLLRSNGVFVVDTRIAQTEENNVSELLDGYAYYIPTHQNIVEYASLTQMQIIDRKDYITKGITRSIYTIRK